MARIFNGEPVFSITISIRPASYLPTRAVRTDAGLHTSSLLSRLSFRRNKCAAESGYKHKETSRKAVRVCALRLCASETDALHSTRPSHTASQPLYSRGCAWHVCIVRPYFILVILILVGYPGYLSSCLVLLIFFPFVAFFLFVLFARLCNGCPTRKKSQQNSPIGRK